MIVQAGQTSACYDADFYPFGGEIAYVNSCPQNYKFEGHERDAETGYDNFGARYYNSSSAPAAGVPFGRFTSADWSAVPAPVPYANLTNPQTLNLYAIVADDPATDRDADGHTLYLAPGNEGTEFQDLCNFAGGGCEFLRASVDVSNGLTEIRISNGIAFLYIGGEPAVEIEAMVDSPEVYVYGGRGTGFLTGGLYNYLMAQQKTGFRQEVIDTISFQKDARRAYKKFGKTATTVDELENEVDAYLSKKYGEIGVAGTTSSSGTVEIKPDPNPFTREATRRHEGVHKQSRDALAAKYGADTPAFNEQWYNPQRWAADEVKAYSAGISYLQEVIRKKEVPE